MRARLAALGLGVALVAWGNLLALLGPGERDWSPSLFTLINGAVVLVVLWRGWAGVGWWGAGLGRGTQLVGGGLAGLALAIIPVGSFLAGPLLGEPLRWSPTDQATPLLLAWRLLVAVPLGVALFEEVVFRGWLYRLSRDTFGRRGGWAWGLLAFCLWHLVVTWASVSQTAYAGSPLFGLAWLAALAGVAVGGAVFLALRAWSGGLAMPVVAHWTINTSLTLSLLAIGLTAA